MVNNMEQQQQQHGNRSQCIFWRSRQLLTDIFKGSSDLRIKLVLINSLPIFNQYFFKSFALTFFNLLCRSRQGVGWDRGARIQLRWVHFGVFELKVRGGLPFITGLVDLKLRRLAKACHKNEEDEVCPHGGKVLEWSFFVIQIWFLHRIYWISFMFIADLLSKSSWNI